MITMKDLDTEHNKARREMKKEVIELIKEKIEDYLGFDTAVFVLDELLDEVEGL